MRSRALPYLILLAAVLLFFRHALFYPGYVIPWDLRNFHLPHAAFLADHLARGEFPLWDPYTYFGRPLAANIQAQWFYPPLFLTVAASNLAGGAHLLYFLELDVVAHIFAAGVFSFWLLRTVGAGPPAALAGALVYEVGCFFASQAQHMGAVHGAAWLPLAWLLVVRMSRGARAGAALAAVLAMAYLSGLPAVTLAVLGTSFLVAILLAATGQARWKLAAAVPGACAFAALAALAQLAPSWELNTHSIGRYRMDWLGAGGGVRVEALASLISPNHYNIFDLKRFAGPGELTFLYLFSGWLGLALALSAIPLARRRGPAAVFLATTLAAAFVMLGDSTPLWRALFPRLPAVIRNPVHPEFFLPAFSLGVAVLAGLGAERWLRRPALGWAAALVVAAELILVGSGRPMNAASLADEPGVTRTAFDGSRLVLERMRLLTGRSSPPSRIDTLNDSMQWAASAPLIGLHSANGIDPLALARPIQVRLAFCEGERWGMYYQVKRPESRILDLVNVRYLLSRTPAHGPGLALAAELPGRYVYENADALPRFFLVGRIRRARNPEEAALWLRAAEFEPSREAIVEAAPDFADSPAAGSVKVLEYRPNTVVLETEAAAPAFLVTSEAHYPGWRATIDGRESPLYYTNLAFRGLPVPAGRHQVRMEFAPAILWWSGAASLLAWIALAAAALRRS